MHRSITERVVLCVYIHAGCIPSRRDQFFVTYERLKTVL